MFRTMEGPWPRQAHFAHYMHNLRCTYSLTLQIDITALRQKLKSHGLKVYPAQIYMLASIVNQFPEFRMGISEAGQPGYWEQLHPSYTIFNRETHTFSSVYTPYDPAFHRFYKACLDDMSRYAGSAELFPRSDTPPNTFDISSLPWVDFSAFNLNVYTEGTHLLPIFTIGRYTEQRGQTLLPLAMQLHHAACDGYHVGLFTEALRAMVRDCDRWL